MPESNQDRYQALAIVQRLKQENHLTGKDKWMEDDLKQRLQNAQ